MRKLTVSAVSLALASFAFSGAAVTTTAAAAEKVCDGPKVNWRLSLWGKRRAFTEGLEYISKTVKERTCGNFNIKLYYGDQLSKGKENLDGISVGAFEAALFCASYHPGKNRALNVLDLPFLPLDNLDIMLEVHNKIYNHPAAQKDIGKWNAVLFMSNVLPQYEYMGRGKPPASVADFKGKRLRALGGMGAAAKAIGAVPTTMPASETYTALQRGTVDAIGFPFTYTFAAYKLDEIAEWYTTNMSLGTVNCPIVFNKTAFGSLDGRYKKVLSDVKKGASEAQKAAYAAKDKINLAKWGKNAKLKAVKIPDAQMAEFRKVAGKPVWEKWVKDNEGQVPARELLDLVLATAKKASMKK